MNSKQLTLTRLLDAPREVVFKAWTEPEQLARWWGPSGFTNPRCEADVRPGGRIHIDMTAPDGTVFPMGGVFREVIVPEKLVFTTTAFEDPQGHAGLENLNTVLFSEEGNQTRLTLHVEVLHASAAAQGALSGMEEGWTQSLVRLSAWVG